MPKVLISDSMNNAAENILKSNNIEVDVLTNLNNSQLIDKISDYEGLIVRSTTQVTKDILDAGKKLKIIGRAGAGVDNIDLKTSNIKNIIVMNTPGGNTNATAEHTMGLLFSLIRSIPDANNSTHKGLWEKKRFKAIELKNKSIGIIGFGNVGKRFAEMCFALGMKVNIYSKYFESIKKEFINYNNISLESLIEISDIISLHCKANKDNSPIIDINNIKRMKNNSFIINTARGNLINEIDLKNALENNLIKGAAIDVYSKEPAHKNILFNTPNLILTPHIAASTIEAQVIVAEQIAKQISDYFNSGKIINAVTL